MCKNYFFLFLFLPLVINPIKQELATTRSSVQQDNQTPLVSNLNPQYGTQNSPYSAPTMQQFTNSESGCCCFCLVIGCIGSCIVVNGTLLIALALAHIN